MMPLLVMFLSACNNRKHAALSIYGLTCMNTVNNTRNVIAVSIRLLNTVSPSGKVCAPSSDIRDRAKENATAPLKPL